MFPHPRLFLSGLAYNPQKRQVCARFSNAGHSASFRYDFRPRAHFHAGHGGKGLTESFSNAGLKRLRVTVKGEVATVIAQDFETLEAARNTASDHNTVQYKLLPPERGFLLEKGWNYFDSFELGPDGPQPLDSFEFPDARLEFLSGALAQEIEALAKSNPPLAAQTARRIALSRLLKVPVSEIVHGFLAEEALIENVAFSCGMPIVESGNASSFCAHSRPVPGLDFSGLLCLAICRPMGNLGFESICCDCCGAQSAEAKNLLPSSLVKVRFLREGFYFNAASQNWAENFHSSRPMHEERELRKTEYGLDYIPAGPFCRGEEYEILLCDAIRLREAGEAEIINSSAPHWACSRTESSLSAQINSLRRALESVNAAGETEKAAMAGSGGLLYYTSHSTPSSLYRTVIAEQIAGIFSKLPRAIANPKSPFFSAPLATALECISRGICSELEQEAALGGNCRAKGEFGRVIVDDSEAAHSLFRGLSTLYKAGKPYIKLG